jgi:hypothetical protein
MTDDLSVIRHPSSVAGENKNPDRQSVVWVALEIASAARIERNAEWHQT